MVRADKSRNPTTQKRQAPAKPRKATTKKSGKPKTSGSPRNLGKSLAVIVEETFDEFTVPVVTADDPNALKVLGEFLQSLDSKFRVGTIDIFDRGKGWMSWMQGAVLQHAFEICQARKKSKKRGMTWGQFLSMYWNYSEETARICRNIRKRWEHPREVAAIGYWAAAQILVAERGRADSTGDDEANGNDEGKGKGKTEPKPPTLSLGKIVGTIFSKSEELLSQIDALSVEIIQSPEREGAIYRGLGTKMDGALRNLARAVLKLHELAAKTNDNSAEYLSKQIKVLLKMVKAIDAIPQTEGE